MGRWAFMLGGLIVWTVHFGGVYGIASIADVAQDAAVPPARWAVGALTAACVAADAVLAWVALRRPTGDDSLDRFATRTAATGAGLSAVAVVWQGLPALVGH